MHKAKDIYAKRTLDFIERIQQLRSYDEICAHILKEMEWFGFRCVTSFSVPGAGQTLKDCLWMNNRPQDYIDRYSEKKLHPSRSRCYRISPDRLSIFLERHPGQTRPEENGKSYNRRGA
jgi:hypothetical protein